MWCSCRCIVAWCTLRERHRPQKCDNGSITTGLARYEMVLHSCGTRPWREGGDEGERYRLVTVRTHGDFIMLPHWNTRLPTPWPAIPLSCIILTLNQPVLSYPNNAEHLARKHQAREQQESILKSLVLLNHGLKTVRCGFKPMTFRFLDLPEWEADARLIRPHWLVSHVFHR